MPNPYVPNKGYWSQSRGQCFSYSLPGFFESVECFLHIAPDFIRCAAFCDQAGYIRTGHGKYAIGIRLKV